MEMIVNEELKTVLSNCDAKRDHNYREGADSFTITTREYAILCEALRPEVEAKIRNDALEEAAQIALRRTEIPRDARKPTRDQVVIVGEEIAQLIREKIREPQSS